MSHVFLKLSEAVVYLSFSFLSVHLNLGYKLCVPNVVCTKLFLLSIHLYCGYIQPMHETIWHQRSCFAKKVSSQRPISPAIIYSTSFNFLKAILLVLNNDPRSRSLKGQYLGIVRYWTCLVLKYSLCEWMSN